MVPHQQLSAQSRLWWFAFVIGVAFLRADQDPPVVRTYESTSAEYVFRVVPNWGEIPPQLGSCQGQLFRRENGDLKLQWERSLVNNVAPNGVFVANSGKYVVTICEWVDEMKTKLPIAIYGGRGLLINVWGNIQQIDPTLKGFLSGEPAVPWPDESLFLFGRDDATFIIRTNRGRTFVFRTEQGDLVDERWKLGPHLGAARLFDELHAEAKITVLQEAIRLRDSNDWKNRKLGQLVLSQHADADSAAHIGSITRSPSKKNHESRKEGKFP